LGIKEKSHIFAAENQEFKVKNSTLKKIIGTDYRGAEQR
jgi:hypothetical protein